MSAVILRKNLFNGLVSIKAPVVFSNMKHYTIIA